MLGILREVAKHTLKIKLGSKPEKQRLHRFDKRQRRAIGEETTKLLAARFIKEVYHPSLSHSCTKEEWEMENVC